MSPRSFGPNTTFWYVVCHGISAVSWNTTIRSLERAGDAPAVEQNLTSIRPLEACDQIDQRRLAATGRADDDSELARQDMEREILDDILLLPLLAVGFAHSLDLDAGLRCGPARQAGNGGRLIGIIELPVHDRRLFCESEQVAPGHGTAADHADEGA